MVNLCICTQTLQDRGSKKTQNANPKRVFSCSAIVNSRWPWVRSRQGVSRIHEAANKTLVSCDRQILLLFIYEFDAMRADTHTCSEGQ